MQKKWSITCLLVAISSLAFAQNVGINTTSPDASAVLEVAATDKGMLVPRLTTTQRTTIASPATGLLVYDTTLGAFYFYNGAAWTGINSGTFSESDPKVGTLTTNYVPKWNGSTLANSTVYDNGTNVGIGTTSPNNKLDIQSSSSVTANVQSSGATAYLTAAAPAGSEIGLNFKTYSSGAGVDRWLFGKSNTAESGSNAGSNLFINRYNDAGTLLGQPFTINRSNGYVGIGVGVAQTQLDVAGTNAGTVSLLLRSGNTGASTSSSQIMFGYNGNTTYLHTIKTRHNSGAATGNAIDFYLWNYGVDGPSITGSKHVMTLQGNGCVGIGVTSPTDALEVSGKTKTTNFQLTTGATSGYVLQSDASGNGTWVAASSIGSTNYWTLSGGNIYNNSGTNVGIGTTSPANKLTVSGNANIGTSNTVTGTNAVAIGTSNTNTGTNAIATGTTNTTTGNNSFVAGSSNSTTASNSFITGSNNTNSGLQALVSGNANNVSASNTLVAGSSNTVAGSFSVAFNQSNTTTSGGNNAVVGGFQSYVSSNLGLAIGYRDTTTAQGAAALGYNNNAEGVYAFTSGDSNKASGTNSVAFGSSNSASNSNSVVFGNANTSSGNGSVAFGYNNTASGQYSTAFGNSNTASGTNAVAWGIFNTASGLRATTFNQSNTASGSNSFAAGYASTASANLAVTFGNANTSSGDMSTTFGEGNSSPSFSEFTLGTYSTTYTPTSTTSYNTIDRIFNIGNGSSSTARSDAFTVLKSGNVGVGTASPTNKLEINGKTKTTNLQVTNGANANYVLQSDASGNGTWVSPTALSITESDPKIASSTSNYIPKWNGTALTDGSIYDNGTVTVGYGTPSTTNNTLQINGSIAIKTTAITTSNNITTLDGNDYMLVYSGTINTNSITLPNATTYIGRIYIIVNHSSTDIAISTYYIGNTISSTNIGTDTTLQLVSDGTNWHKIN